MPHQLNLAAATIEYEESGPPDAPPLVFVHGLLVDSALWAPVVDELHGQHCIVPTWPLGSHRTPMRDRTQATPTGVADLIAEFLDRLELRDVTIVANDTGGAITQILLSRRPDRISRVVLTNCDAYENFLPPFFRGLQYLAKARLLGVALQSMRASRARASIFGFGLLSKRPLPPKLMERWVRPMLDDRQIRADVQHFVRHIDSRLTLDAAAQLRTFEAPVLIAWAPEDRHFAVRFAERLADDLPNARVVRFPDSRTFVMQDQPTALAEAIRDFVTTTALSPEGRRSGERPVPS